MESNFFLGIDLGTTNSVISYVNVRDGKLIPTVLEVPRISDTQGTTSAKTLPSVVYYKKDAHGEWSPYVGDFAKAQYGKRYGYVIKSVKSSMGQADVPNINEEIADRHPDDISAEILRQMLAGAKKKLLMKEMPRDVIITIPASFDSDMRQATLDAAQKAGVMAYHDDGTPRDILLYEPKAVLYDFVNSQKNGEIPDAVMDVSEPKNVLVYDLGGGTLDVSLHEVKRGDGDMLSIKDIAISRYSQIGGDNFDELIAHDLSRRFFEMYQSEINPTLQVEQEVLTVFRKKAEQLKIEMNNAYEIMASRDEVLPDDYESNIMEVNLYGGYAFDEYVTKAEMLEDIEPLLARELTLADAKRIDQLTKEEQVNNIIYPILDTLSKAYKQLDDVKIDYVILNGGMSKFFPVIERLNSFFECPILSFSDPDMSVAKGAAIYHYLLHKYQVAEHMQAVASSYKAPAKAADAKDEPKAAPGTLMRVLGRGRTESLSESNTTAQGKIYSVQDDKVSAMLGRAILNDTLNIGVRGGYVKPLIMAGTELPAESDICNDFKLPRKGRSIRLPLYYGSGSTTSLPNRKIAERVLSFGQDYPAETPIAIQARVDRMGLISISTWIDGQISTMGTVSIDAGSRTTAGKKSAEGNKPLLPNSTSGMSVNFRSEINTLRQLCDKKRKAERSHNQYASQTASRQIAEIVTRMNNAINGKDSGEALVMAMFNVNDTHFLSRLLGIGAHFYQEWDAHTQTEFHRICKRYLGEATEKARMGMTIRDYHVQAINAIALIGDKNDEKQLEELLNKEDRSYSPAAAVAIAKLHADPAPIAECLENMFSTDTAQLTSYAWAIGKLYSREFDMYFDERRMDKTVQKLCKLMTDTGQKNMNILSLLAYALGELCDRRACAERPLPLKSASRAKAALERARDLVRYSSKPGAETAYKKMTMALHMANGDALSPEEDAQLLALRNSN